jgi:hypothetical protein
MGHNIVPPYDVCQAYDTAARKYQESKEDRVRPCSDCLTITSVHYYYVFQPVTTHTPYGA